MLPKDNRTDCKILSYHDVVIRESDVHLLDGPRWLNDVVIHFYYEWLSRTRLNQHPNVVLLVPGAPTYMMTTLGKEAGPIVLDPLLFRSQEFAFFALNNNLDPSVPLGGSHWSLAAWSRSQSTLYHYDSLAPCNQDLSLRLLDALQGYLEKSITLRQMKCGGQENGYDCGIFLLAATEELCNRCLNSDTNKEEENGKISWDLPLDISRSEFSTRFRNSLLLLINQLRFNGLRQDQT